MSVVDLGRALDLDAATRAALELDAVLESVSSFAASRPAAAAIRGARPGTSLEAIRHELDGVDEVRILLRTDGRLIPAKIPDPTPALEAIALPGYTVEPLVLRDLATALLTASDLRGSLRRRGDASPILSGLGQAIPDLRDLARPVATYVQPDGTLADGASAELDRLRRALARTGDRLRRQLESFVHDPASGAVVQDDFVTQRNGRYVIPIRSDAPKQVRGIVHGSSSSGATLFVEPLDSVEGNNELVRLAEREAAERERVVLGWCERFRQRIDEVAVAVEAVVRLDGLQARALWAEREDAVRPVLEEGAPLLLDGLKHPLLDRRLREAGAEGCVPIRLAMDAGCHVLVLSGPNAGGKTVALKALGLTVALAHCGIPVPASEASIPRLEQLRADIGDHQSIEADLSTFSAHLRSVRDWLGSIRRPAIFLFDEIGTGTEPAEGAALAQAILERLRDLGVHAVATTHQAPLKFWAMTGRGVCSAAMEFDEVALRPTFRVLPASAGTSAGIEVAARLGLSPDLVARSREILGSGGREAEELVARLRHLTASLEERSSGLALREAEFATERERIRDDAREDEQRIRREAERALEALVLEFRKDAEKELASIGDRKLRSRLEKEQVRAESRLRSRATRGRAPGPAPNASGPERSVAFVPKPGDRVLVLSLDREAVVGAIRGDRVEVTMGAVGVTVRVGDVAAVSDEGPPPSRPPPARPTPDRSDDLPGASAELPLLGRTVEEALPEVDRYLDRAALAGWSEVRLIHGHGTGRLRTAIRRHLRGHPLAASFRPGGPGEGGDGATVVQLR